MHGEVGHFEVVNLSSPPRDLSRSSLMVRCADLPSCWPRLGSLMRDALSLAPIAPMIGRSPGNASRSLIRTMTQVRSRLPYSVYRPGTRFAADASRRSRMPPASRIGTVELQPPPRVAYTVGTPSPIQQSHPPLATNQTMNGSPQSSFG